MEKILMETGLSDFCANAEKLCYKYNGEQMQLDFDQIASISLEGHMGAKTGAYMLLRIDTDQETLVVPSAHSEYFALLFDILSEQLPVDMEAVFAASMQNADAITNIYEKIEKGE